MGRLQTNCKRDKSMLMNFKRRAISVKTTLYTQKIIAFHCYIKF